ncbi:MAG: antibiotic biosynthesis monooxygenase, partial [Pseudomonadales bacterium]
MADVESVTVVVTRKIVSGKEKAYRAWVDRVTQGSKVFPGHLGAQLQGPGPEGEYHTIFRYDSVENLRRWDEST